ncbi:hypothetical protein BGW39_001888 [Mortierella sp. 14UC]|nr:hypothetical protein BGW39_001888 [Mortierella sp. 14UC]
MKSLSTLSLALIATLAFGTSNTIVNPTTAAALPFNNHSNDNNATISTTATSSRAGFFESLQALASGTPSRTAASNNNPLTQKFIIPNETGPSAWSCNYMETKLDYSRYSVDTISSNFKGHISGFFLIAPNGASEMDIELTGLDSKVGWVNVWRSGKQHPVKIPLGLDASKGWHTYTIEWRKGLIAWYIDNKQVYKRSDIATLDPRKNLYKLVLTSWTSQTDDQWAGRFSLPGEKTVVKTQLRNMYYTP